MGDKKEPKVDLKLLDQTIKKVLAYQPEKKPRAAKKNSGAGRTPWAQLRRLSPIQKETSTKKWRRHGFEKTKRPICPIDLFNTTAET